MRDDTSDRTRATILVLFFVSGACTLVYELVWMRMLVLVFGMSVFAVSTVLAAFMAGLALGSFSFGRIVDRRGNGLRIYAYLEFGIGLFALAFPWILAHLDELYTWLYRHLGASEPVFNIVRFALCFAVLLIPTTLMGATLPVLTRYALRRFDRVGGTVGWLYAINTFGAAVGCLAAAYVLMDRIGTSGTTYVAASGNLIIAGVCFGLSRRHAGSTTDGLRETETETESERPAAVEISPSVARLVLWVFAASGFAALGYEVLWTRLLCLVLHITTVQSVSTILIAFLFGLAAGGAVGARFVDRWKHVVALFGIAELLLGLCGLGSIALLGRLVDALATLGPYASWSAHLLRLFAVSLGLMLIPTFLMGLLFPIAGRIYTRSLATVGRGVGDVYAANTAGAILGAAVTGFVLIPLLGTGSSTGFLAAINLIAGAAVLVCAPTPRLRARLALAAGFLAPTLALALLLPADGVTELFHRSEPGAKLLFHKEETGGTVTVHEFPSGHRVMRVNGAGEVPTDLPSLRTFRLLGNLPMVLHPAPEEVLVIAFGGGITLSAVARHEPRRIDCVEVVRGVVDGARLFERYNDRIFDRLDGSGIEIIVDDGRNHMLRTERSYDVIISDSTHPGTADSWILYTEEFYRLSRARMNPGGIFTQWLPIHGLGVEQYKMILRTFRHVFPHGSLWMTRSYTILVGSDERLRIDFEQVRRRLSRDGVRQDLEQVDLADPFTFVATLALDEHAMGEYTGPGRINTDDRPYISFDDGARADAGGGLRVSMSLIERLTDYLDPYLAQLEEHDRIDLRRHVEARKYRLQGDVALGLGDRPHALEQYRRALAADSEDNVARRLVGRLEREPIRPP